MRHVRAALWLALMLIGSGAFAGSYYVDTSDPAASDSNPGSAALPWKTIQQAVNQAVAGDTVYIKAGVYYEAIDMVRSGSAGAPIVLRRYGSDRVVIDGGSSSDNKLMDWKAGSTGNRNYITIEGLEIRNSAGWGLWIEGDHNQVIDCQVHDNGLSGSLNASGIFVEHGKYNEIRGNEVYHNKWNGINLEDSEYSLIDGNRSYDNGHMGVNVFSDTGTYYGMMSGNNITNNVIYNNTESGIYSRYQQDNLIANNVIYSNNFWGIFLSRGGTGGPTSYDGHTKIYNNTVTGNGYDGIYIHAANYVTIENNIIVDNKWSPNGGKTQLRIEQYTGQVVDYNLYDSTGDVIYWNMGLMSLAQYQALGYETHGLVGVSGFSDPAAHNYRLTAGSSAVDRGVSLAGDGVGSDIEGTARPQGGAYDQGAYELVEAVGSAPPAPPANLRVVN